MLVEVSWWEVKLPMEWQTTWNSLILAHSTTHNILVYSRCQLNNRLSPQNVSNSEMSLICFLFTSSHCSSAVLSTKTWMAGTASWARRTNMMVTLSNILPTAPSDSAGLHTLHHRLNTLEIMREQLASHRSSYRNIRHFSANFLFKILWLKQYYCFLHFSSAITSKCDILFACIWLFLFQNIICTRYKLKSQLQLMRPRRWLAQYWALAYLPFLNVSECRCWSDVTWSVENTTTHRTHSQKKMQYVQMVHGSCPLKKLYFIPGHSWRPLSC